MNYVELNSGHKIPQVGLGTWRVLGDDAYNMVLTALKNGYRHIDTAMIYHNEEDVGRAIKDSGIPREELFVTTKLWNDDQEDVETALNTSLKKLGLEYVDLYLMHWPLPTRINAYAKMEQLQKAGRIRSIGVSNFTENHLKDLLENCEIPPAVNQIEFNPFLQQKEISNFCREQGIAIEAYCPLAHGQVLDNEKLAVTADKYGKSPAQIILKWSVQSGAIVIPKSIKEQRLIENISLFDFELSEEDLVEIASWDRGLRYCRNPYELE